MTENSAKRRIKFLNYRRTKLNLPPPEPESSSRAANIQEKNKMDDLMHRYYTA